MGIRTKQCPYCDRRYVPVAGVQGHGPACPTVKAWKRDEADIAAVMDELAAHRGESERRIAEAIVDRMAIRAEVASR